MYGFIRRYIRKFLSSNFVCFCQLEIWGNGNRCRDMHRYSVLKLNIFVQDISRQSSKQEVFLTKWML